MANIFVLDVENEYAQQEKEIASDEILCLVERIKKDKKNELSKGFEGQIKEAEKLGDREKIKKLIRQFQKKVIGGKSYGRG